MVKSVIMLIFREGKTAEEELKAWQFWHSRPFSKTKNLGCGYKKLDRFDWLYR